MRYYFSMNYRDLQIKCLPVLTDDAFHLCIRGDGRHANLSVHQYPERDVLQAFSHNLGRACPCGYVRRTDLNVVLIESYPTHVSAFPFRSLDAPVKTPLDTRSGGPFAHCHRG